MLRAKKILAVISALVWGAAAASFAQAPANDPAAQASNTVAYPAPSGEKLSEDFTVMVAGQAVPVYLCRVSAMPFNQVWPGYQRPIDQTELASFVYWDMSAPVDVEVVSQRAIESVAIRPTARGIQPQLEGNRIRFHLETPQQLTVEVNGWHKALHVFANPPAVTIDPNAPGVRYFGPGIHRPGRMTLQSGETVYLAGGAVVYGCIEATDAANIRILGPGILDSSELERYFGLTDESKYLDNFGGCVHLVRCTNVTIDGPILRDPPLWCLSAFNCSEIQIAHTKLIGLWRYNADGIDLCNSRNAAVRDCFVRSFDDSLVVKGLSYYRDVPISNILFEGCVVWNDWGRALEIGAETATPELSQVTFRDCDIVRTAEIAMDVQHGDHAAIHGVTFERIRFEVDDVNYAPQIQNGRDATYTGKTGHCPHALILVILRGAWSSDQERGTMRDIVVRDCSVTGNLTPSSALSGFDETHDVKGVTISNMQFNGKAAATLEEAAIHVGQFVSGVHIEPAANASPGIKKDKILFLGNSITLHAPSESIGWTGNWGMAASAEEKDYVHLVVQALSEPAESGIPAPRFLVRNIADFERQCTTYSVEENLKECIEFKPDLLILAIGENVPGLATPEAETQFYESVGRLLKAFQKDAKPAIIVRSGFWPSSNKDACLKRAAGDAGATFLDISALAKDEDNYARSERQIAHAGVAGHPGDRGMKAIADAIVNAIKKAQTP
ncbi:MAG TPA: glycosyl hydrolase family 28 protein [Candidatus Hydrogenedentes bacterium]|mgnify:CR=1 FL=1|nr:glycosyl hydrolase family 28 protein [Candidatus Hydrogenedentota bacterium]